MIDLDAGNTEIRARLREQLPELVTIDSADGFDETMFRSSRTPAAFVMIRRTEASELVPGLPSQRVRLDVIVGIVTESLRQDAATRAQALTSIMGKASKALHWWKPSFALERLKFRGEDEPIREGTRLGQQMHFSGSMQETYT